MSTATLASATPSTAQSPVSSANPASPNIAGNPEFRVSQKFFFDAAHTLQRDIEREGSLRIHGHTYHAEVTVAGPRDPVTGMVVDLGLVRLHIEQLRPQLDHRLLDEVPGLNPATLENLCAFIWRGLAPSLPGLSQVRVWRDSVGDSCTLECA